MKILISVLNDLKISLKPVITLIKIPNKLKVRLCVSKSKHGESTKRSYK